LYGDVTWRGEQFLFVDTGGIDPDATEGYPELIRQQVERALAEAAALLFVVDARSGVIPADREIAELLRRSSKPVLLLANKVDNEARREQAVEFFELGFGEPIVVSAQHGSGTGEVLDRLREILPPSPEEEAATKPRLAIVGRPNVGKSMLLNAILNEERVIVSPVPGTTRDAIDTPFDFAGRPIVLIDTAGLRRPGKVEPGLEHHASLRARHALERADVALVVFDAKEGLTAQDTHVLGFAIEARTGVVLVANKWDLMDDVAKRAFENEVRRRLRFAPWAEFAIVSAKERDGIAQMLEAALGVCDERTKRIETSHLNSVIRRAVAERPLPLVKNRQGKILYVTQAATSPPTFVFFVNDAALVHFSYRRYLENVLREQFGYEGVALKINYRSRKKA
jgi:GTP-binding protein